MYQFYIGLLYLVYCPAIFAAVMGHGAVSMNGSIVAAACTLSSESYDQQIELGSIPINTIMKNGHGPEKSFSIKLEGCEPFRPGAWDFKSVRLTFDGQRDESSNLLRIQGEARGVGLSIKESNGSSIVPGIALANIPIQTGMNTLNYSLAIEKNHEALFAGNYRVAVRFKVEYY